MNAPASPQALFAAAERAFAEGRLREAQTPLALLERMGVKHPAVFHLRAIVEHRLGNLAEAQRAFEAAAALAPGDPHLANNHGNLLGDRGDEEGALAAYERALAIAPDYADAALNRAIALHRLKRFEEARAAFRALEGSQGGDVRLWNALGAMERDSGGLAASAEAYDKALALQPDSRLAVRGRARVAFERGEGDVLERFAAARRLAPDDKDLLIEEAEARMDAGDRQALATLEGAVRAAPDWTEGQLALARLRRESGDVDGFGVDIEAALRQQPRQPDLWTGYVQLLAGCGRHEAAADAARAAREALGDDPGLKLAEAIHASRAGDQERAAALYAALPPDMPGKAAHETGFRVRLGELDRAVGLIDVALAEDDGDIGAWAVAELIYRAAGDARSHWLSGQEGLVSTFELPLGAACFGAIKETLLGLHAHSAQMVGQSVRDGTQTRGRLFDRTEPELAELKRALEQAIRDYAAALPPADPAHPLLRHRDRPFRITGSWSVRLTGSGHHISHFHPEGLISSACYFIVPDSVSEPGDGWLEIGRAPPDFGLDLEPLATIRPEPGRLALFPSYLHHGTRPFSAGERMTVAFDVTSVE